MLERLDACHASLANHSVAMIELPRITPVHGGPSHVILPHGGMQPIRPEPQSTSLPSIASLRQNRNDDLDDPVIAPMSERLTCNSCTQLRPIMHDVSLAVAELDQTVQAHCQRLTNKVSHHASMLRYRWGFEADSHL